MKTYKVGMVGFGFIGKVHAYGHMNIPLFYEKERNAAPAVLYKHFAGAAL